MRLKCKMLKLNVLMLTLILGLGISGQISAQQRTVQGMVTDNQGSPLPGVTVVVKGTTQGTVTNADGYYTLTNLPADATLQFSFVGMKKTEVAVGSQTNINLVMEEETIGIEELVVIGYGIEKKINVIGSISQITSKDIENQPITNLSQALTGQMSGVTVIQRSGKPGGDQGTVRIRGIGSFGATPSPLILIDGLPGTMSELNPGDVESISVLKDASSAAIYGARAANGVILITTKKGKEGDFKVNYSGFYGIQWATEFPDMVNSWEYAEMYNIASGTNTYSPDVIEKYKSMSDPDNYPNTNFLKEVFSRNGILTGHDISISGGHQTTQYYLSLGYLDQIGLIEKNNYNRYNFRLNAKSSFSSKLSLLTRVSGSFENQNEPIPNAGVALDAKGIISIDELIWRALREPPVSLGQASNGDFGFGRNGIGTPISWLKSASYKKSPNTKADINFQLDWTPITDLIFSVFGGYNFGLDETRAYMSSQIFNSNYKIDESRLNQARNKSVFQTIQYLAKYSKEIKGHNIDLLAGYSFEKGNNEDFSGFRQDFPSNDYTVMDMGGAENQFVWGNDYGWALQSLFSRLKYNYLDKYLMEFTVRHDGSSRFPPNKKYATFPSMAIGWRISEEKFFESVKPFVSNLKIKASWGTLGNQNIGNYPYQSTLNAGYDYPFGSGISTGAALSIYKDPTLHWESTKTSDIGIEIGFLDNRFQLNAAYFSRNTFDILYKPSSSVSDVLGLSISESNTGEVKNSGWEFELVNRNKFRDFGYDIRGVFSLIHNEVITLGLGNVLQPNGMVGNGSDLFIGYPMEMYYGYITDGVFLDNEDISSWANQTKVNPNSVVGDIRYVDISGPEGVPDNVVDPTYDRTYLGSRIPKYTFSLNTAIQYKSFDLTAYFQGVAGVKGFLSDVAGQAFAGDISSLQRWQMDGRFDPNNPVRYPQYPRLSLLGNNSTNSPNGVLSDFWVLDASYFRLKNLQLGYTVSESKLKNFKIEKLRIYFSGENLYTFKKYRQGWDPEINSTGYFYPILGVMSLGINASF